MLRPCVAYGGGPKKEQLADLGKGCDILIGTVGRLNDIIRSNPERLSLNRLKFTILDEADEMLDAGTFQSLSLLDAANPLHRLGERHGLSPARWSF